MTSPLRLKNAIRKTVEEAIVKASRLSKRKNHTQSIEILESALALIPEPKAEYWESALLKQNLGTELMQLGKYSDALNIFNQTARTGVIGLPVFHINREICLLRTGSLDLAVQEFLSARQNISPQSDWVAFFRECGAGEAVALIENIE